MLDFTTLVSGMLLGTRSVKWVSRESGGLESAVYIRFDLLGRGVFLSGDLGMVSSVWIQVQSERTR